jgi:hypothetical protein
MRRHPKENNAVVFAEYPELWCCMASMVVKNKEPLAPNCLLSCMLLKMPDPLEANLICSPAIWANCESLCRR